ncbi:hypothetical protein, partial [Moorena sp. SIO2C4]|uniref:hypothetical protein n=1 Tax=Moorena sp. SIO2C4 TaxID=2607824 RepID=UPI00257D9AF8
TSCEKYSYEKSPIVREGAGSREQGAWSREQGAAQGHLSSCGEPVANLSPHLPISPSPHLLLFL